MCNEDCCVSTSGLLALCFLRGAPEYKPVIGSVNGEAKAGRGSGETKLKCCRRPHGCYTLLCNMPLQMGMLSTLVVVSLQETAVKGVLWVYRKLTMNYLEG